MKCEAPERIVKRFLTTLTQIIKQKFSSYIAVNTLLLHYKGQSIKQSILFGVKYVVCCDNYV